METSTKHNIVAQAVRDALATQRSPLLAMVRRRGGTSVDAEEVLQLALQRALERSDQLRDPARAEAWLGRVVRNVLLDVLRKHPRPILPFDENDLPAPDDDDGIDCWCVLVQAEQLKSEYAVILRRVVIEGAPVKQVAAELGLTPNNAMVRLHRARKALKERLEAHCGTVNARSCSDCGCEARGCCPRPASHPAAVHPRRDA